MLNNLKELIFGLNSYEKTKIEDRYELVFNFIKNLKIQKLEDFEILGEVIFKIKEELRVKSSNLNKIIKNSKRNLNKKEIINLLDILNKIKYDFLNEAFNFMKKKEDLNLNEISNNSYDDNEILEEKKEKEEDIISENEIDEEIILIENNDFEIKLKNSKTGYILINFKEEINFSIINKIAIYFFEVSNAQGTNIIIEDKKVLIIPRFIDDNLINLPRIQVEINDIYKKIKLNINKNNNFRDKEKTELKSEKKDFIEIDKLEKDSFEKKKSLKEKEDSLDSLLDEIENKKPNLIPKSKLNEKDDKIKIIDDDKIEILHKEKNDFEIKGEEIVEANFEEKNVKPKTEINQKYLIYSDDKIIAYLKEDSKVLGELIIEEINKNKISNLDEGSLAYLSIFSKVFSSILFESLNASGTNLIYDFDSNKIRIIPRFEKDNLNNLKWDTKSNTNEFLDQVRNKLILKMSNEKNEETENLIENKKEIKEDKTELENRAKYILEELRRIP